MHLKEAALRRRLRSDRNEGKEEDAPEVNGNSTFLWTWRSLLPSQITGREHPGKKDEPRSQSQIVSESTFLNFTQPWGHLKCFHMPLIYIRTLRSRTLGMER